MLPGHTWGFAFGRDCHFKGIFHYICVADISDFGDLYASLSRENNRIVSYFTFKTEGSSAYIITIIYRENSRG